MPAVELRLFRDLHVRPDDEGAHISDAITVYIERERPEKPSPVSQSTRPCSIRCCKPCDTHTSSPVFASIGWPAELGDAIRWRAEKPVRSDSCYRLALPVGPVGGASLTPPPGHGDTAGPNWEAPDPRSPSKWTGVHIRECIRAISISYKEKFWRPIGTPSPVRYALVQDSFGLCRRHDRTVIRSRVQSDDGRVRCPAAGTQVQTPARIILMIT
jgi:hypothetical protein